MTTVGRPGQGRGMVLRRQPASISDDRPDGGYGDAFEIICRDCGDDPGLDYRAVSTRLRLLRGPFPLAVGVAAYEEHIGWHQQAAGPPDTLSARSAEAAGELAGLGG